MRTGSWLPLLLASTIFQPALPSALAQPGQVERPSFLPLSNDFPDLVGSEEYIDVALRNSINAGVVPGPRMLVAVHALGARGG